MLLTRVEPGQDTLSGDPQQRGGRGRGLESGPSARVTWRSAAQVAGGRRYSSVSGGASKTKKKKKGRHKIEHWLSSAEVRKARNIKGEEEEGG